MGHSGDNHWKMVCDTLVDSGGMHIGGWTQWGQGGGHIWGTGWGTHWGQGMGHNILRTVEAHIGEMGHTVWTRWLGGDKVGLHAGSPQLTRTDCCD